MIKIIENSKKWETETKCRYYLNGHYAKKGNMCVDLQTNATTIDKEYAKKLSNAGLDKAFVSLHAHNEILNEKITRVSGMFDRTIKGIKLLMENGIEVSINIVINSLNYMHIDKIVKLITSDLKGIYIINFSYVAPIHNAIENKWIIPKISDALPYIKSAFDLCISNGVHFSMPRRCGIPICFIPEYEKYLEPSSRSSSDSSPGKIKPDNCHKCEYFLGCEGIWKEYIKIYGSDELRLLRPSHNENILNKNSTGL